MYMPFKAPTKWVIFTLCAAYVRLLSNHSPDSLDLEMGPTRKQKWGK